MNFLRVGCRAVALAILLAIVSGCGGGAVPSGSLASPIEPSRSWIEAGASSGALLYVGGRTPSGGAMLIYSFPQGKFVGSLDYPGYGLCSDSGGNIYITYEDSITKFAHGGTTPLETLRIPGAELQFCAVDPTTGNLAVTFYCAPCGYQDLAIFPNGSGKPSRYMTGTGAYTLGYDGSGNLFISGLERSSLIELTSGSERFITLTLNKDIGYINQVQWDGRHITLQQGGAPGDVYRISVSGSSATVLTATKFHRQIDYTEPSWIYDGAIAFGFQKTEDSPYELGIWRYPRGEQALKIIGKPPVGDYGFVNLTISAPPSH